MRVQILSNWSLQKEASCLKIFFLTRTRQKGTPLVDGRVTAGTLFCAIPTHAVSDRLEKTGQRQIKVRGSGSCISEGLQDVVISV
jgi:hypothetical protein